MQALKQSMEQTRVNKKGGHSSEEEKDSLIERAQQAMEMTGSRLNNRRRNQYNTAETLR
jgi:hypothetical protein